MMRRTLFTIATILVCFCCAGRTHAAYLPGFPVCTSFVAISQTASTDLKTFTNKGYICSIVIVSSDGESLSLVQGTGTTCATGTGALIGATTAANGMAIAANGGVALGNLQLVTTTTAQHLCLLQSGTGRIAGVISYADQQ